MVLGLNVSTKYKAKEQDGLSNDDRRRFLSVSLSRTQPLNKIARKKKKPSRRARPAAGEALVRSQPSDLASGPEGNPPEHIACKHIRTTSRPEEKRNSRIIQGDDTLTKVIRTVDIGCHSTENLRLHTSEHDEMRPRAHSGRR